MFVDSQTHPSWLHQERYGAAPGLKDRREKTFLYKHDAPTGAKNKTALCERNGHIVVRLLPYSVGSKRKEVVIFLALLRIVWLKWGL